MKNNTSQVPVDLENAVPAARKVGKLCENCSSHAESAENEEQGKVQPAIFQFGHFGNCILVSEVGESAEKVENVEAQTGHTRIYDCHSEEYPELGVSGDQKNIF